ncbi:MAG: DNA-binding transcriptional LysR family regulator [Bermanella sp.]|jgi:DNA-binding transcriptional LysR family regulator|uniref:LysR family transcriptional regulator n=1 Tax=Brumicola pallidula DSM 14239 = ACAM 615 TaxID=1121922 RepID=K6Z2E6_9ALTE|nr:MULTISPECIES: LysR family transcriptional regulator [Glaciecola]PKH99867.1 LysR family transcriptional regulator [Glaciecola sp. 33A]GAC30361.1 LysR family transcriptional regulator [Glaciecola pallidula DSM 14239 = ACAM 615]
MLNRLQESDIKLLRVFYAVASCNGFTAAEPVLRMQRPNISAAIKKLEERLDLVLCHRGRGGFQMTKEGEVVFQETKRIFNAFDNFVFNLKSLHDDYSGHITLVLMAGLATSMQLAVSKAVKSTMKKFDDIHVNIQTRLYNEVEHVALSGECHLVLSTYDMVKPESVTFHSTGVQCKGRLYCSPTHTLAKYREADALPDNVRIEDFPAIGMSGLSSVNYISGEKRLAIQTFSDSYDVCMAAVMTGEYVGLLPDYIAKEQGAATGLVPICKGSLFEFSHELFVMNGKNTRLNPVLRHCIKELEYFVFESQK